MTREVLSEVKATGVGERLYQWSGQVLESNDYLAFIGRNPDGAEGPRITDNAFTGTLRVATPTFRRASSSPDRVRRPSVCRDVYRRRLPRQPWAGRLGGAASHG